LLYLRARYYDPGTGRFTQEDPGKGDYEHPLTINPYLYTLANPVNSTDPTGLAPWTEPEQPNHRDLTYWLYNELHENANGYYARRIRSLLANGNPADLVRAHAAWILLVMDRAKWDFKHKIREELGDSIVLRDGSGYRWYEWSVPGNIFYAFVGRAAGFPGWELHAGAGFAEIIDPTHVKKGEACCPQYCRVQGAKIEYCFSLGCYYVNPKWWKTGFDQPGDWWNVEFGVKLYDTCGRQLTFEQFENSLSTRGYWLTPAPQTPEWNWINPNPGWPYKTGRFDGPNEAKYELPIQLLLLR
jgi:hypothetical protein